MIYVVEEQQATWLFASLSEAIAFDNKRRDEHRHSVVTSLSTKHSFNTETPDCPMDFGPGQEKCKRIQRHIKRWWKARDAWWNALDDY
jgi:hypothetical protein